MPSFSYQTMRRTVREYIPDADTVPSSRFL
jgi:hypothetical protein